LLNFNKLANKTNKMYNHLFITVFLLAFLISTPLYAQNINLEILDHTEHRTIMTSFLANKVDVVYAIENDRWGYAFSQVKFQRGNDIPQNILPEDLPFHTKSKWFYNSNGDLRLYLYDLRHPAIDYFSANFVEVIEENGIYISRIIENQYIISLETVMDIALDSLDQVYAWTSLGRLQLFGDGTLLNEVRLEDNYKSIMHSNIDGEVFLLNNDYSGSNSIYKVNDLQLELVNTINHELIEAKNINDEIWALDNESNLLRFNKNFSDSAQSVNLPFDLSSLDQVSVVNNRIFLLNEEAVGFSLYQFINNDLEPIRAFQEDFASSSALHMIDETSFLSSGQFEIEDIANHAFFRSYDLNQEFNPIRNNLTIEEFDLFYLNDTIISGTPWDLFYYGIDFNIENLSTSNAELNSIYTSNLLAHLGGSPYLFYENQLETRLKPNVSRAFNANTIIPIDHPRILTASLTGSNYKFNVSYMPIQVGLTTSTSQVEQEAQQFAYPNPFFDRINFNSDKIRSILFYNSLGELIYEENSNEINNHDFSKLGDGIYFLKILDTNQTIKMVKSR